MFTVDEPGFPIALLAILAGLRLAVYVVERMAQRTAETLAVPTLAPDERADASVLALEPSATQEMVAEEEGREALHPSRAFAELLDSGMIAVLLVFFLIRPFVLQAFYIPSGSMIPTLQTGDKLLAAKYVYHLRQPHRGEVIVFHAPEVALEILHQPFDDKHPVEYVKRVVGVPGDHIHIVANEGVFVNDQPLTEPYIQDPPNYDFPVRVDGELTVDPRVRKDFQRYLQSQELVVPKGYLFVLGDNRTLSHDSHIWGLLPESRVIGKALFIFWPTARVGFIH